MKLLFLFGLFLFAAGMNACGQGSDDKATDNPGGAKYVGGNSSAVAAASPSLTTCYKGDVWACAVEATIVKETNLLRQKALLQSFEDSFVAREWSSAQAEVGKISHDGFPDQRKVSLLANFNASWGVFAENVAMARTQELDPVRVGKIFVQMWNGSPGHRTNMLGNYTYLGAGVARVGNSIYATQIFH